MRKLLSSLSSKTSPLDIIPTSILKLCPDIFSEIITELANKSFSQGRFPSSFKLAQIRPLLKKPGLDEDEVGNYRPISNLSTISKIFERLFLVRLHEHLSSSSNINIKQSAFKRHHSTETVLPVILNEMYREVDRKRVTLLVALDISAAFDTLEHRTILRRLESTFGISGSMLDWIGAYITNRKQFVVVDNISSASRVVEYGVPQGSVLGPIIFTLYTAPIGGVIEGFGFRHHQYADDTQLFISFERSNTRNASESVCEITNKVRSRFNENDLQLNPDKSEAILLGTRQRLKTIDLSSVTVAGSSINTVDKLKSLGVTIDSALTFDQHVKNVSRSSYSNIRALRQIRTAMTRDTAKAVAAAIVSTRFI